MEPDDRLIFLLGHAWHRLYTRLDQALVARSGVTAAQAGALFHLMSHDGCLLSQLSQGLMLDKSAITGLVDRLEKKEMVERRDDPSDRRAIRIYLTKAGRAAATEALAVARRHNSEVREGLSAKEIETFSRVLQAIIQRFVGEVDDG